MTDTHKSRYFALEPLASGVWASMSTGGLAMSNAGIIDLGERVLIFDTHGTPSAGEALHAAAEALTGNRVAVVANSHWHNDHVVGNQSIPAAATIVSTARTRELIAQGTAALVEAVPEYLNENREKLVSLKAQRDSTQKGDEIAAVVQEIFVTETYINDMLRLSPRLPEIAFEQRLTLYGTRRTVELVTFGGGHTESDVILWLPEEGIAFVADLLFNGRHPWAGHGNPGEWMQRLDDIEREMGPKTVIPGHGAITTVAGLEAMRVYMQALQSVLATLESVEDIEQVEIPEELATLDDARGGSFQRNLRALYERQAAHT